MKCKIEKLRDISEVLNTKGRNTFLIGYETSDKVKLTHVNLRNLVDNIKIDRRYFTKKIEFDDIDKFNTRYFVPKDDEEIMIRDNEPAARLSYKGSGQQGQCQA